MTNRPRGALRYHQGDSSVTDDVPKIDTTVPHSARIWNYWLGGRDNYEIDRVVGERYQSTFPGVVDLARASRAFLVRSIRYMAETAGVRQFIDIGTGLPTAENTHEVAQNVAPDTRVLYVDNDPLVLAHARALLISGPEGSTEYLQADVREPERILARAAEVTDPYRPVGLILSGVMGHVAPYAEARSAVRRLLDGLPAGSYLSLNDGVTGDAAYTEAQRDYNATGAAPYWLREPEEIEGFFDGLQLVPPGVVACSRWRPGRRSPAAGPEVAVYGGVGRKP
ncbi:SAM-dependent methyltransferase [Streptomyces sp. 7-21]|nr:SAM-dependent methyltransferase [Streptomyces sp. 7-21]